LIHQFYTYYTKGYPAEYYRQPFHDLVVDLHNQYDSLNILLDRGESVHNDDERFQDLEESIVIDKLCKTILDKHDIPYHTIKVDKNTVKKIMKLL